MHLWHCRTKPTPTVSGQLHVDQFNQVWEWTSMGVGSAWKQTDYRLEKTREYNLYMREIVQAQAPHIPGRFNAEWDAFHRKSFAKVSWDITTPLLGTPNPWYISNISHNDLVNEVRNRTRKTAGPTVKYADNATISVFEAVDITRDAKVLSYNELYSQMRGVNTYNRKHGRSVKWAGSTYTFRSNPGGYFNDVFWPFPGADILNTIVGGPMVPSVAQSDELFWVHSSGRGLYRHPKVGSAIRGVNTKTIWDGDLGVFRTATVGEMFTVEPPRVFYTQYSMLPRMLEYMGFLKGTTYWYRGVKGFVVYPLHIGAAAPAGQWAMYIKPYGVDTLGIGHQMNATWSVVAEYVYDENGGERETQRKVVSPYEGWDAWNQLHRVNFHTGIGIPHLTSATPVNVDSPDFPKFIKFYALNVDTGLRSPVFSRGLRVVKRKCNVTSCLEPAVFRTP